MPTVRTDSRTLELIGFALIAVLILVVLPMALDIFRLNLVGKYLTYAFVAVGLVLCWGHTGILSLGQGVFFGLGGYCMAAFLKLEASSVANTKIQSTPGIPDFMDWNQLTELPFFWVPFNSLPFALIAVFAVPTVAAFILGAAMFKRRVGGVYFAIITQALAAVMTILIVGRQGYTGGINGITDLRTLLGWDIRIDSAKYILYFLCCFLLLGTMLLARFVVASKLGRILVAVRDKEDRVRFSGYDVANFKIFVFCLASAMAALGGAMFALQVGFMSPSFVGIVPSIEMVIFCAVGGRHSIVGAVVGTLVVNWGKTLFSESFPELWLFAMGGLFIAVVLAFPRGLAGLVTDQIIPRLGSLRGLGRRRQPSTAPAPAERAAEAAIMASNTDFLLALENVSVSFDGFKAVNGLNLYIDKGELRVIIGPNGAGKTTVLDLICGRTKVSEGSIKFKDQEITGRKEQEIVRLGIGRKFQTPTIYEDLTVFENLELSVPRGRDVVGALFWKRTAEISERVREIAATIFLEELLDRPAETLSHGQKQWLEIGMLLIQDPELLMLDEPVAGMSVAERAKTAGLLKEIIKNRSVVVIEHDMKFVESIAHRVTVLHQGQVLAEGDMHSVQANPKVKEVYLGH
jgi:urea transport system permease protein